MLRQLYFSHNKTVIGYDLSVYDCTSKNRLQPIFILRKEVLREECFKAGYQSTGPNVTCFFCLSDPVLLIVLLCVTEVQSYSTAYWKQF